MRAVLGVVLLGAGCSTPLAPVVVDSSIRPSSSGSRAAPQTPLALSSVQAPDPSTRTPSLASQSPPAAFDSDHQSPCSLASNAEILEVPVGTSAVSKTGLEVTFVATSRDEYHDGRFEVFASFGFRRGAAHDRRMPSVLALFEADEVLGHCWRLVEVNERLARIAVSPQPNRPSRVRHLGDGRCQPMPREHTACAEGEGYCVVTWGSRGGWSSAFWCRGGRWELENEMNSR
jgi:hypothetical protein